MLIILMKLFLKCLISFPVTGNGVTTFLKKFTTHSRCLIVRKPQSLSWLSSSLGGYLNSCCYQCSFKSPRRLFSSGWRASCFLLLAAVSKHVCSLAPLLVHTVCSLPSFSHPSSQLIRCPVHSKYPVTTY